MSYLSRDWNCDIQKEILEMKSPANRKEECFHHVHQSTKHGTGMNQQSYNTVLHTEMQRKK